MIECSQRSPATMPPNVAEYITMEHTIMAWPNRKYHYSAEAGTIGQLPTTIGVYSTATHAAVALHGLLNHSLDKRTFHTMRTLGYLALPDNQYVEIVRCACHRNPDHVINPSYKLSGV